MPEYKLRKNILAHFFARTAIVIVLVVLLASIFFYYFELHNFKQDISVDFRVNTADLFRQRDHLSTETDIQPIEQYLKNRIQVDRDIKKLTVYDENLRPICSEVRPGFPASGFLEANRDKFPFSEPVKDIVVEIVKFQGKTYLWFGGPVRNISDNIIGYAEAIKEVDPATIANFRHRRLLSIAAGVFFVLLLAASLFPLFVRAYRELRENEKLLLASNLATIKYLGDAIALRDSDTSLHNFRVTLYAIAMGEELKLSPKEMRTLIKGAFLHDVGKIGIKDNILLKSGTLTEKEFDVMKTHVELGKEIVSKDPWFRDALDVIHYHHEKFDGQGYPNGMQKDEIPLNARIFAIVDVFDALTSDRPYRSAYRLEKAQEVMKEGAGTHFDPELLEVFLKISPELYRDIAHLDKDVLERLLKEKVEYYFL